jgi:hypothetical protein
MITAKEMSSAQSWIESGNSTQCGCQVSPDSPTLASIAPASRESSAMALVDHTLAGFTSIVAFRAEEDFTPPDRASSRHSQSVLCTFLI